MWTVRCAFLNIFLLLILSSTSIALGGQTIVLNIILNHEAKGDFFINMTDEGDFFIKTEDLKQMGFKEPQGKTYMINDEQYIALGSMKGVGFHLDEKNLALEITALPSHLGKRTLDFTPSRQPKVYFPKDSGGFLNYSLDYAKEPSVNLNLTNQLGIRFGDLLFLSDSTYAKTEDTDRFVRLMSNVTYDRREEMQRIVFGDFFASSGDLGSSLNLGGISYSKAYLINPYFIKHPQIGFSGTVSLPTDVYVYLDGIPIRQERLSAGEFELNNISAREGAGLLEVVLRDPFGNEQRIRQSFYLTDANLKKGLHDYSYNIGFLRNAFGEDSFKYDGLALSAFHRYGISDSTTVNFMAEAAKKRYNLGPAVSYKIQNLGIAALSLAHSRNEDGQIGFAGSLSYGYQGRRFNASLLARGFSKDFTTVVNESTSEKIRYEATAGIGYGTKETGSFTIDYVTQKKDIGEDRQTMTAGYSKTLLGRVTFLATFRRSKEIDYANEFIVGLHYYSGKDISFSTRYQESEDVSSEIVQIQKNPPVGEGFGGRASFERTATEETSANTVDTFLQYNGRYGIYTGEYLKVNDGQISRVSAAGSIAYVGRTIGLSRPVTDSFGLVEVGDIKGVRVYNNSQEIGRTDSSGRVLIPNLSSYYDNQISVNDGDIPMEYSIPDVVKYVSPPLRSGSYIEFQATRFQAVTGRISMKTEGEVRPAEFYETKMMVDSQETSFSTGKDGEFYLENIKPGSHRASITYMEKGCSFDIIIPKTEDVMIDLGELVCEDVR